MSDISFRASECNTEPKCNTGIPVLRIIETGIPVFIKFVRNDEQNIFSKNDTINRMKPYMYITKLTSVSINFEY